MSNGIQVSVPPNNLVAENPADTLKQCAAVISFLALAAEWQGSGGDSEGAHGQELILWQVRDAIKHAGASFSVALDAAKNSPRHVQARETSSS